MASTRPPSPRPLVLVIEDEPALKQSVLRHLTAQGFDVASAVDRASARLCIQTRVPDAVCVDLRLPRESGYEMCEYLRIELSLRELPIVFMSDRSFPEDRAHAVEAGASAYIVKPFALDDLSQKVQALLAARDKGKVTTP